MKRIKTHYHWIVAAVALLQMLIYGGVINNLTSYHIIPVSEGLSISRTAFSLAVSVKSGVAVFSIIGSGMLIQKMGYRKTVTMGLIAVSGAFLIFSLMRAYWMLVAGCVLVGLAEGICATSGVTHLINRWFHRRRGLVLGLVTAATGVGSTLVGVVQTYAIDNISWRASFSSAVAMLFLTALAIFFFVRNAPDDIGLKPYGEGQEEKKGKKTEVWSGYSMEFLRKRPAFYLMILCSLLSCICISSTQHNIVPHFQDMGMTATEANKIYGTMMLILGLVKLSFGALSDKIGARKVALICLSACAAGLVLLLMLPVQGAWLLVALLVYVLGIPLTTLIVPLLSPELFGRKAQSQYIGIFMSTTAAAPIIAGPLSNFIFDKVGSYRPVFWSGAAAAVLLIGVYCVLYGMVRRDRKNLPEEN